MGTAVKKGITAAERTALIAAFESDAPDATAQLNADGASLPVTLERRTFSSGSVGFYGQTKLVSPDGRKYQVGITMTLVGSKPQA